MQSTMNLLDQQLRNEIPEVIFTTRVMVTRLVEQYINKQHRKKIDRIIEKPTKNENEAKTASQVRSTTPLHIRRITDLRFVYGPGEDFTIAFECQAWLGWTFKGSHHVLTILEPFAYAMNIIV